MNSKLVLFHELNNVSLLSKNIVRRRLSIDVNSFPIQLNIVISRKLLTSFVFVKRANCTFKASIVNNTGVENDIK